MAKDSLKAKFNLTRSQLDGLISSLHITKRLREWRRRTP